ncbi:hypothetical protein WA158_000476 [Blastocystis sp. Blastoise]
MHDNVTYNENLLTNPFFIALKEYYPNIYDDAPEKEWIVCIPCRKTLRTDYINKSLIMSHIIYKSCLYRDQYVTLSHKSLELKNGSIHTYKDNYHGSSFSEERNINILFDEQFVNTKCQFFKVLCLEYPLEGKFQIEADDGFSYFNIERSPEDMKSFLEVDFNNPYYFPPSEVCVKDSALRIKKCIEETYTIIKRNNRKWQKALKSEKKQLLLKQCIESYIMQDIYKKIFANLKEICRTQEKIFQTLLSYLGSHNCISPSLFEIPQKYYCPDELGDAIIRLQEINIYKTVKAKLSVIEDCMNRIIKAVDIHVNKDQPIEERKQSILTADEIFPLYSLTILLAAPSSVYANILFINTYDFFHINTQNAEYCFSVFTTGIADIERLSQSYKDAVNTKYLSQLTPPPISYQYTPSSITSSTTLTPLSMSPSPSITIPLNTSLIIETPSPLAHNDSTSSFFDTSLTTLSPNSRELKINSAPIQTRSSNHINPESFSPISAPIRPLISNSRCSLPPSAFTFDEHTYTNTNKSIPSFSALTAATMNSQSYSHSKSTSLNQKRVQLPSPSLSIRSPRTAPISIANTVTNRSYMRKNISSSLPVNSHIRTVTQNGTHSESRTKSSILHDEDSEEIARMINKIEHNDDNSFLSQTSPVEELNAEMGFGRFVASLATSNGSFTAQKWNR